MTIFSIVFSYPLFVDRVFYKDKQCFRLEIEMITFVTCNRYLGSTKSNVWENNFFVLRPFWEIVIKSESVILE